jgi:3',5'-cyclic AMP phosphodiesterase CpdA
MIVLAFVSILKIKINYKNNFFSAQINSPAKETTKIGTPAGVPEPEPNLPIIAFAVISDVHIQSRVNALERFNNALLDLTENIQPKPDAIVMNGDLGDGTPEDYTLLSSIIKNRQLNTEGKPLWFATIGNHEFYNAYHDPLTNAWSPAAFPNGDTDAKAIERFTTFKQQEKVYNDTYIKGYHFIFLGSEKSVMSDKGIGESAYLSSEQLSWLDKKLQENYLKGKPIFVFLHQPLFTNTGNIGYYVIQREQLNNILKKYREIILFSGHLHLSLGSKATVKHNVFTIYNDSSTSRPISPDFKAETEKSEGLFVEVFQDKVEVKGRDFINKTWIFHDVTALIFNHAAGD